MSPNGLGSRRLAELLIKFVGRMVLLVTLRTRWKEVAAMPMSRTTVIKVGRETTIIVSSRSRNDHR